MFKFSLAINCIGHLGIFQYRDTLIEYYGIHFIFWKRQTLPLSTKSVWNLLCNCKFTLSVILKVLYKIGRTRDSKINFCVYVIIEIGHQKI